MKRGGFREEVYGFAGRGTSREWISSTIQYVSARPGPEGWARVRAGEGAGQAYLSSAVAIFSDAKRSPARDGGGDEYGQRGGFEAVPAVPAAPREDRHEPDEDGAKSEVMADRGPCRP